ncbi:hypothetical protein HRbin30_01490 [bacterium HR30]|nr:hypothetical protein HRbin30_01490 [bacterium HR30]
MSTATASEPWDRPAKDARDHPEVASLKLSLLLHGVKLDASVEARVRREGHWLTVGTDQRRLELQLPDATIVAPLVVTNSGPDSTWMLLASDGELLMQRGQVRHSVFLVPPPSFYEERTSSGRRLGDFAQVLGDVLVLGGAQACGYSVSGSACRFCRVGSRAQSERTFGITAYEAAEAVTAAARGRRLKYVFLPAASFDAEDGGVREIEPLVKAVRRHTSALVLAALHPPRTLRWIDHAYAIGVDGIGFNLEVPDVAALERFLPGRARYLGRSRYYHALRHAAKIFPRGAVWTELLLGSVPAQELATFAREFLSWGVIPFLVPVRPDAAIRPTALSFTATAAETESLLQTLADGWHSADARRRWLPNWPHVLGPTDVLGKARFHRSNGPTPGLVDHLALFALRNVSRIRRSLRVRDLAEHDLES